MSVLCATSVLAPAAPKHATPDSAPTGAMDAKNPNVALYMHAPGTAPAAEDKAFPQLTKDSTGCWEVDFNQLAYLPPAPPPADEQGPAKNGNLMMLRQPDADLPPPAAEADPATLIPEQVRPLDGKRVRLEGYMLPVRMENGLVKQFLAIRSPMVCCYGVVPGPNEWVVVTMAGKGTVQMMDIPLNFIGTLHVGAIYENKIFEGLYRLDCEKVALK